MFIFLFCISYFIGTFPSGVLVAKRFGVDVTTQGSGSVGATNIARVLGKKAGVLTLILDIVKGILGTSVPWIYGMIFGATDAAFNTIFLAGFATVLGHCLSLPGLKGGKGVATSLGALLAINPWLAISSTFVFILIFLPTRIVSLSSIACAAALPVIGYFVLEPIVPLQIVVLLLISVVVTFRHKKNIERLLRGEEAQFSSKK